MKEGPYCMVILFTNGRKIPSVHEVIGPFQTVEEAMDYTFGKRTVVRQAAEDVMVDTNIPFMVADRGFVLSEINAPWTEEVQNLKPSTKKG